jgi:predicted metal-dependent hydrolase
MPSPAQNIQVAIANIAAKIVELSADPRPSYEVDGQRVEWTEFMRMLVQQLETLRKSQMQLQGPVMRTSRGVPY